MRRSLDDALAGFAARAAADADLAALLGVDDAGAVRLYHGWPGEVLENPRPRHFPRATYYRSGGGEQRRPGVGRVRIRLDLWVWPSGEAGGIERLSALDSRFLEVLDEQHWTHSGARLYAVALDPVDFPAGPGAPLRRMRPFDVHVSPA